MLCVLFLCFLNLYVSSSSSSCISSSIIFFAHMFSLRLSYSSSSSSSCISSSVVFFVHRSSSSSYSCSSSSVHNSSSLEFLVHRVLLSTWSQALQPSDHSKKEKQPMTRYERQTPSTAVAKRSAGCPEGLAITIKPYFLRKPNIIVFFRESCN